MQNAAVAGFRLAPQQEHVWLQQQPDHSHACRVQGLVLIDGDLHVESLKAAVAAVVARHEILRTIFQCLPGMITPLQVITDNSVMWGPEYDLSHLSAADPAQLDAVWHATNEGDQGLDAGLAVSLIKLAAGQHALSIRLSALCADRATLEALVTEIARAYTTGAASPALADEPLQYADLTEWQHDLLDASEWNEPIDYWRAHHIGDRLDLKLPFQTQAQGQAFIPASCSVVLEPETVAALEALAQHHSTSLRTLLLVCWQSLLARFTQQSQIVVGLRFDLREKFEDLEGALGPFAKYLPIVSAFTDDQQLQAAVQQIDAVIDQVYSWQEGFSWNRVAEETEKAPSSLYLPFCFAFEEQPAAPVSDALRLSIVREVSYLDRFTVQLTAVRQATGVVLRWDYDTQHLSQSALQPLAAAMTTLLYSLTERPHTWLARAPLLTPAAHDRRVGMTSPVVAGISVNAPALLPQAFEAQVARTPDAIALVASGCELTYAELNAQANQLARHLQSCEIDREARIAVLLPRSPALIIALLAILKAGGAYLPLDPRMPPERLALTLADAASPVILTDSAHQATLPPTDTTIVLLDTLADELSSQPADNLDLPIVETQLAYVLYTSGSTGRPKGVMIPHEGLANYLAWAVPAYQIAEGQGSVVHSPLSFDLTVTSLWGPLVCGRSVVLLEETEALEALALALAAGSGYSLVKLTPAHMQVLAEIVAAEHAQNSTRVVVIGGEALHAESLAFWQRHAPTTRLINEYGPTETVVGCSIYEAGHTDQAGAVPIGQAVTNTQLYVLDRYQAPVAVGMVGELYIGGAQMARGYLQRPGLTAEKFIPDPFTTLPGARMYRTGDLVRYLLDGNLEFLGRIDRQVKMRGYRIELEEVEAVLRQHPSVQDCVVTVREDNANDQRLVGYVVLDQRATTDEIHQFATTRLPSYMVPAHIVAITAMPLTTNGKIDLLALPKPDATLTEAYVAPRTVIEAALAEIWAQLLDVPQCSVDTSFFALGGHSLLAIQLMSRVQAIFQVQLSMYAFFDAPTIAELAELIIANEAKPGQTETIARIQQRIMRMSADDKATMLQAIQQGEV